MEEQPYVYMVENRERIEEFVEQLPDSYVDCRAWRHGKKIRTIRNVQFEGSDKTYWEALFFCDRCGTEWVKVFDPNTGMQIWSSQPRYPEGYTAPKGLGPIRGRAHDLVKAEALTRAM